MIALAEGSGGIGERLYRGLTKAILEGRFAAGDRLPSTRGLAAELGISRNTVNAAYARLEAEGYALIEASSGARVAEGARLPAVDNSLAPLPASVGFPSRRFDLIDFKSGLPETSGFPAARWLSALSAVLQSAPPAVFGYGRPEGRPELREAISKYVGRYRGARCSPDQVLVTAGTTQAISVVALALLGPGRRSAVVEEPLTADIKTILAQAGAAIHPSPVDEQGLDPSMLPRRPRPALVYVTPSHQFPLGSAMPIQRRIALLEYARSTGAYVVEDDYDSEFRYEGPPLPSMQGLDPERVVYIGTFSKTLSPALRIGYIILPLALVGEARKRKWLSDIHNPVIDQLALARFMEEGQYASHISRMKKLYRHRRELLAASLEEESRAAGIGLEILGASAGIHLCARFPGKRLTRQDLLALEAAGAKAYPVAAHALSPGAWEDALILGFGSLGDDELRRGAGIVVQVMANAGKKKGRSSSREPARPA
jgi:GntR family transcriptional regulator/MocR family aminotransferase